jgi:hypothetical protein
VGRAESSAQVDVRHMQIKFVVDLVVPAFQALSAVAPRASNMGLEGIERNQLLWEAVGELDQTPEHQHSVIGGSPMQRVPAFGGSSIRDPCPSRCRTPVPLHVMTT